MLSLVFKALRSLGENSSERKREATTQRTMSGESDEVFRNAAAFEREEPRFGAVSRLAIGGAGSVTEAEGCGSVGYVRRTEQAARALRSGHG